MRYTFISAHSVRGISHPNGSPDLVLFQNDVTHLRVILTSDVEPHLRLLNRHLALMSMMLRALIGMPLAADFADTLAAEMVNVWEQRRKKIGNDPVVIVEVHGDVTAQIPANARDVLDFVLCFDAFDKKAVKSSHRQHVSATLTSLRISVDEPVEFQNICDGSYLHTDDGRIVHSATVEGGSVNMYVSRRLGEGEVPRIAETLDRVLGATGLERVMRLHTYSLTVDSDNYRAFLASWAAMEILVGKLFPEYHKKLIVDLGNAHQSPGLQIYLNRMSSAMDGRYSLSDKFAVLSVYLDDKHSPDEVASFISLKKVRNQLSHGEELEEATLPTRDVQRLFDKYIRAHIHRAA